MKLTKAHLEAAKSTFGGYSGKQLALIGLKFPLPKSWRRQVIGLEIPDSDLAEFVALKDKHYNSFEFKRKERYYAAKKLERDAKRQVMDDEKRARGALE